MAGKISFRRCSKHIAWFVLCAGLFSVSSCRQIERPFVPEPVCPKKMDLNFDQCPDQKICTDMEKCRLAERLEQHQVQVFRVGEDMRIVIPSDQLFLPHSANLNCNYAYILPHIATLLFCYDKVDTQIAGYTDCYCDAEHNRQLSLLQAQTVMKFLWRQGIDTRLLFAKGFGPDDPIAGNRTFYQRARNRRIEITFRDIPNPLAIRGEMVRDMEAENCPTRRRKESSCGNDGRCSRTG